MVLESHDVFSPIHPSVRPSQEAICSSLEEYNQHIDELKQEMEEATESAKRIREDIQEMRNKYGVVESQEKCAACDFPLLNRPFYLFLCGHMFHYDCLFQVTERGVYTWPLYSCLPNDYVRSLSICL